MPTSIVAGLVTVVYFPMLATPFLYDDYTHLADAAGSTRATIFAYFAPAAHRPGLFFRPLGFTIYWFNYAWAGMDPWRWHLLSLLLHIVNCCLLWAFCLALDLGWWASYGAALIFGVNACLVESVAWVDARFDLLATGLILAALICVCRYAGNGRAVWLLGASIAGACAVLTKESAFCLPLLLACLVFFRPAKDWWRLWTACGWITAITMVLFAYRWWVLGGIGGYRSAEGDLSIFRFNAIHTLDALFVRDWAILLFPVNWSLPLGSILRAALVVALATFAVSAWWSRASRRHALGCVAFTFAAALPVQHLLLLDTDLGGSRLLYLPAVGLAALWGSLFGSIDRVPRRLLLMGLMVAPQALILRHNLSAWQTVSREGQSVCLEFGRISASAAAPATVRDLPQKKNGVVFLANGFPQCVEWNSGVPRGRIHVENSRSANFAWNPNSGRIEAVSPADH